MASDCEEGVKQVLLQDPRVQALLVEVGGDPLRDPRVLAQINSVCKERFPALVDTVSGTVNSWADDPEMQAKMHTYLSSVTDSATSSIHAVPSRVLGLIEQGPDGVRFLAFVGALASVTLSGLYMFNIFQQIVHPIDFTINLYQLAFGITTLLFEANPSTLQRFGILTRWYEFAIKWAPFLTTALGRGLFVAFQGVMWIHESKFTDIAGMGVGCYMLFVGAVLVALHWGIMPVQIAEYIRNYATSAQRVARRSLRTVVGEDPQATDRLLATSRTSMSHSQVELQQFRSSQTNHKDGTSMSSPQVEPLQIRRNSQINSVDASSLIIPRVANEIGNEF